MCELIVFSFLKGVIFVLGVLTCNIRLNRVGISAGQTSGP
jgi:hypothetical protein